MRNLFFKQIISAVFFCSIFFTACKKEVIDNKFNVKDWEFLNSSAGKIYLSTIVADKLFIELFDSISSFKLALIFDIKTSLKTQEPYDFESLKMKTQEYNENTKGLIHQIENKYRISKLNKENLKWLISEIYQNYLEVISKRRNPIIRTSLSECNEDKQLSYGRCDRNYYISMGLCGFSLIGGAIATVPCVLGASAFLVTCYGDADEDYKICVKRATTTIN